MKEGPERQRLEQILHAERDQSMSDEPLFALAKTHRAQLPHDIQPTTETILPYQPIVIAKNEHGQSFVGRTDLTDKPDFVIDWLVNKPVRGRKSLGKVTHLFDESESREAELQALIYERFLPESKAGEAIPSERQLLLEFTDLARRGDPIQHPEIFTARSVFNDDLLNYPLTNDRNRLLATGAHPELREELIPMTRAFLQSGLQYLEHEPESPIIRQTAARFSELYQGLLWDAVFLTSEPERAIGESRYQGNVTEIFPAPESIAFIPSEDTHNPDENLARLLRSQGVSPHLGDIIIPVAWLHTCATKPHQALAYLLRTASLVRDHSYGKLLGEVTITGKGFPPESIKKSLFAAKRADDHVYQLIKEAEQYDAREFGAVIRLDTYCQRVSRYRPSAIHYDNPDSDTIRRFIV